MEGVFANRNEKRDFVINELVSRSESGCDIFIASAFFTTAQVVEDLLAKGCNIMMVVRLGFPTHPEAIKRVYQHPKVQLRYFTSRSFHPKLYIFGDDSALVGSANLTHSALMTNQEVMVAIDSADDRFIELGEIFQEYFSEAEVLTPTALEKYRKLFEENAKHEAATFAISKKILEHFGDKAPSNITRGTIKNDKKSLFISSFRRTYQEGVSAFNIVRDTYAASGYRKADPALIPLRVEIDSFISFVRQKVAVGDSWRAGPLRTPVEQIPFIAGLIEQWRVTSWPYFEQTVVDETYPRLKEVFGSRENIMEANDSELFDALSTLHSFHDRLRFFEGGLPTWKREFATSNDPARTRETLAYLIYGSGDIVERMANAIFDPLYKLNEFGRANVQELIGWLSREDLPVINSRTTKILRYFGSNVRQL
jgi:HKD family nuclease